MIFDEIDMWLSIYIILGILVGIGVLITIYFYLKYIMQLDRIDKISQEHMMDEKIKKERQNGEENKNNGNKDN
jgi:hypothetical protein